jgi:pilus assembly protein CpaB
MARLSPGTMTAAIVAILIGLAGAYSVRQYLEQESQTKVVIPPPAAPPVAPPIAVPVAARPIVAGQTVTADDVFVRSFSDRDALAKSEYSGKPYMDNVNQITGQTLRVDVKQGGVFMPELFYADGMGPGVSELLRPGQCAVTIPVKSVGAVEGFANPGTVVDVLFRSDSTAGQKQVVLTLLERVDVLAIDRHAVPGQLPAGKAGPATVTLGVAPRQAKALKVVEGRGELSLVLRSSSTDPESLPAALTSTSSDHLTLEQLLGLPPEVEPQTLEIYAGAMKQVLVFDEQPRSQPTQALLQTPILAQTPVRARGDNVISEQRADDHLATDATTVSAPDNVTPPQPQEPSGEAFLKPSPPETARKPDISRESASLERTHRASAMRLSAPIEQGTQKTRHANGKSGGQSVSSHNWNSLQLATNNVMRPLVRGSTPSRAESARSMASSNNMPALEQRNIARASAQSPSFEVYAGTKKTVSRLSGTEARTHSLGATVVAAQ